MLNLRRILVPTDFSESAALAWQEALRIAGRTGATVHVLHIAQGRAVETLLRDTASDAEARKLYVYVGEWLGLPPAPPPAEGQTGGAEVRALRHAVSAAEGVLAYAEEHAVDLIVMGTHGRTGMRRWVLGSVAEEVLRRAACPVLTIREGSGVRLPEAGPQRILVPVDFSEPTRSLIGHARVLAALNEAQVDLLYVIEEPSALRLFKVDGFRALLPEVARRSREMLEKAAEEADGPYVPIRAHVLTGEPPREIVRFAEAQRHDGILMGAHGRSGLRRLAMGSVAERVMRTAPCPVLALKAFGHSLIGAPETDAAHAAGPPASLSE